MRHPLALTLTIVGIWALAAPSVASAEVALLVNDAMGINGEIHGTGHASVYLSNLCSDDAVTVRVCVDGESGGVVVSTYPDFLDSNPPYWVAVPLNLYLFGSKNAVDAPVYGTDAIREAMEARAARQELKTLLGPLDSDHLPDGYWSWVVGNVLLRNVYAFHLKSTPEQDEKAVAVLNDVQHRRQFDISANNCSDFARLILNTYFPKAVHRDALNDLAMTTPKAVARTLTGYAKKHPELEFDVTRYRQIEGTIGRSQPNRNLTERILTSKKYLAAMLLISPYGLAGLGAVYMATARFSIEGALAQSRGSSEDAGRALSRSTDVHASRTSLGPGPATSPAFNRRLIEQGFDRKADEAIERGLFSSRKEIAGFAALLDSRGVPEYYDEDEGLRLRVVSHHGDTRLVGLTRTSITLPESDPQLAYQLMLSVVASELDAGGEHRPTMDELGEDWHLLNDLHDRPLVFDGERASPIQCAKDRGCEPPPHSPVLLRILKFITH